MAVIDYGNPEIWDLQRYKDETQDKPGSAGSADELMQRFAKYINITKFCKAADKNCMKEINYKYLNGKDDKQQWRGGRFSTVILNDGSILYNYVHTTNCSADIDASKNLKDCASFYVDLNGYKGPNQRGIDMFEFALTNQGFIPKGDPVKGKPIHSFDSTCSNKNTQGFGCTAWVLRFDNMDYLKCDDLSWNGKHSCSD